VGRESEDSEDEEGGSSLEHGRGSPEHPAVFRQGGFSGREWVEGDGEEMDEWEGKERGAREGEGRRWRERPGGRANPWAYEREHPEDEAQAIQESSSEEESRGRAGPPRAPSRCTKGGRHTPPTILRISRMRRRASQRSRVGFSRGQWRGAREGGTRPTAPPRGRGGRGGGERGGKAWWGWVLEGEGD